MSVCLLLLELVTDVVNRFVLVSPLFSVALLLARPLRVAGVPASSSSSVSFLLVPVVFHRNRRRSSSPRPQRVFTLFMSSQPDLCPRTLYAGAETHKTSLSLSLSVSLSHTHMYIHIGTIPVPIFLQYGQHSLTPESHPRTQSGVVTSFYNTRW